MKKFFENAVWWSGVIMVGLVLGISLQFVRAWTEPTAAPPGGNVGAPVNTSPIEQLKQGALGIVGLLKMYGGLQVPSGVVSGTPQAGYALMAKENPPGSGIYDGTVEWQKPGEGISDGYVIEGFCQENGMNNCTFCQEGQPNPFCFDESTVYNDAAGTIASAEYPAVCNNYKGTCECAGGEKILTYDADPWGHEPWPHSIAYYKCKVPTAH